jgi:hypothetical protein
MRPLSHTGIGTTTQYSYLPGLRFQTYTYDAASNRKSLTGGWPSF